MVSRAKQLMAAIAMFGLSGMIACSSVELAAPVIRARTGPAAERPVRRIVAVPATCGALSLERVGTDATGNPILAQRTVCPQNALAAVDQIIRSTLELGGFSIIDGEKVNAITAARHEVRERFLQRTASVVEGRLVETSQRESDTTTTETIGARFEDATPHEQREMLAELGAQGVLTTRITIGAEIGVGMRRLVTVQLQLLDVPERVMVWARRCELEIGGLFATDERAMERTARCAVEGIVAR